MHGASEWQREGESATERRGKGRPGERENKL